MQNVREIIRLIHEGNLSNREIAKSCHCSPTTVGVIASRYKEKNLTWPEVLQMDDNELASKLYPQEINSSKRPLPDYDYIHKELMHKGVTLLLLWQEYKEKYPDGVQYTQFCDHYLTWRKLRNISMHQIHRAGEKMFTDWAGLTGSIIDRETGEVQLAYFFVAVLGASKIFYTEPFLATDLFAWNQGHVHAFEYFEGSTEIIVPDNTKTAVKKPCYYEPEINPTYLEMAKYYEAVVIPARVRKPKDKSPVEKEVQDVEQWIIAKLRHQTFFSLYELKQAVSVLLEEANNRPFQKRDGSRRSLFETIEKPNLKPLPVEPYEFAIWNRARVNVDYHIEFEKNYYSVPHQLVKQEVMLRVTAKTMEIFHKNKRIASHARQIAKKYIYATLSEHMPPHHQVFGEWTPERIIHWSKTVGLHTAKLVSEIMARKEHPEQAFRACMGIIRLAKSYTKERVENAAKRALIFGAISYQSVLSILQKNLDLESLPEQTSTQPIYHENLRGSNYYSGEVN
jgi:transposase